MNIWFHIVVALVRLFVLVAVFMNLWNAMGFWAIVLMYLFVLTIGYSFLEFIVKSDDKNIQMINDARERYKESRK